MKREGDVSVPLPIPANPRLELIFETDLELALVVADLLIERPRWIVPTTGIPRGIVAVEPVERVEHGKVCCELVTPRHLEGLGDAEVEALVADVLLGPVDAAEVAVDD